MKTFFKDYVDLYKQSGVFMKKHWFGVIVLNAVLIGGQLAYFKRKNKKFLESLDSEFHKNEEEA